MIRKFLISLFVWIALPIGLLGLIYHFRMGVFAICLYSFFMLLLFSRSMTLFWVKPIGCEREISNDVIHTGGSVNVLVKITNRSFWPVLWLFAEESLPPRMAVDGTVKRLLFLPPGRSFHLIYTITLTRRGCHQLGPLVIESGDVFGLFKKCRIEPRKDYVTALPRYDVLKDFQIGERRRLGDFSAARSIFEDPTRIRGIREYRRGDALKHIHWKSSARTGQLCSKVFDPVVEAGATVVLDFQSRSWPDLNSEDYTLSPPEKAVEIACTICRYLADGHWKVGFFSNGRDPLGLEGLSVSQAKAAGTFRDALRMARRRRRDRRLVPVSIRARRSPEQFSLIHEHLGRIELSNGLPLEQLLMDELPYIEREQVITLIVGNATDSLVSGILRIRTLGYRLMVFVVDNPQSHDRIFNACVPHGIEVFDMDQKWRLKEIATGRRSF